MRTDVMQCEMRTRMRMQSTSVSLRKLKLNATHLHFYCIFIFTCLLPRYYACQIKVRRRQKSALINCSTHDWIWELVRDKFVLLVLRIVNTDNDSDRRFS